MDQFFVQGGAFIVRFANGYTLTFRPDVEDPSECRMLVQGHGSRAAHKLLDSGELWRQIKTFSEEQPQKFPS